MIVDFGVCLRLPSKAQSTDTRPLISPQGICGGLHFEAPEVASNSSFDGEKVDLFAVGVILFVMVAGFAPWERPHFSDERFRYMSGGYLAQMLNEWELGLSPELMDLLQAMLWLDPKDRLSLEQVQDHAWMKLEG
jgi:serine/threonine-protein kinase Chk1